MASRNSKRPRPRLDMHDAVRRYDVTRLKNLVDAGAPLTEVDDYNRTPLHLAVCAWRPEVACVQEMVTILLSTNDEDELFEALCARSDDGMTPLHLVASCGTTSLMDKFLVSVGVELVEDILEMKSHLKGALWNGNWGKKASDGQLEELDVQHMTLLHVALERLDPNVDDDDDDDDGDEAALSDAARAEGVAMVKMLIQRGANVNAKDANGRTPLHQAVAAGLQDMAQLLIESGADPTVGCKAIGMSNNTLHQAVIRGDEEMTRLLIRTAPRLDVNAEGQNGMTPLCLAARSNKVACAKALVDAGADPKAVTGFGKSALDIARTNKRARILEIFGEES